MSAFPNTVLQVTLKPNQLPGDLQNIAEMSFVSSLAEEELKDPGREILVMTVDLGKGQKDRLVVHEHDRPQDLAAAFCRKHGLNDRLYRALTANIKANIDQMLYDEDKADSSIAQSYSASEENAAEKLNADKKIPKPFAYRQSNASGANVGQRLYQKGMQMKGAAALQALRVRQQQEETAQRELTFAPKLSRSSASQLARSEEQMILQAQASKRQLETKRREVLMTQAAECTFAPSLCPR